MIRRNSSNLIPSVVDNPSIAERLTAAEGIRIDKSVTGLNHVLNSVNFELASDNTYILRKPLIHRADVETKTILLFDKIHELVYNAEKEEVYLLNREDSETKHIDIYLKIVGLKGDYYLEPLADGTNIFGSIKLRNDFKYFNTSNSTIITDMEVDLDSLEQYIEFDIYNNAIYKNTKVLRMCSIYKDEDLGCWIMEIINPEINTFTGDTESATNFNPNINLDNPYAIEDLYKYGGNSVTQILPYISKTKAESALDYILLKSEKINIPLEQAVFKVERSVERTTTVISISTKVNILGTHPRNLNFDDPTSELYEFLNSNEKIKINVVVKYKTSATENHIISQMFEFKTYIPAGALICKFDTRGTPVGDIEVSIDTQYKTELYLLDATLAFKDFANADFLQCNPTNYGVIIGLNQNPYIPSEKYGLDLKFEKDRFTLVKLSEFKEGSYITLSSYELDTSKAKEKMLYFTQSNITKETTTSLSYFAYLWKTRFDLPDSLPKTVANLTAQVHDPQYILTESVNENNTNFIILKAFVTTQTLIEDYYCLWEISKDGGETWDVAPEFVNKFSDKLIKIPVVDATKSEETLEVADDYVKYIETVPFGLITSSSNLLDNRPDVLIIPGENIQYKYRFSVYKYRFGAGVTDFFTLQNTLHNDLFKVGNYYITSNSSSNTMLLKNYEGATYISNGTVYLKSNDLYIKILTKYIEEYNPSYKYFYSVNSAESAPFSEYNSLTTGTPIVEGDYTYIPINLKVPNNVYAKTLYYTITVVANGAIIPEATTNVIYYNGAESEFLDIQDGLSDDISSTYFTFIPPVCFKVVKETCRINVIENIKDQDFYIEDTDTQTQQALLDGSRQKCEYVASGIIYNNSGFSQILNLKQYILQSIPDRTLIGGEYATRYALGKFELEASSGTLSVGDFSTSIKLDNSNTGPVNDIVSNLNEKVAGFVTIPANSSINFKISYTIEMTLNGITSQLHKVAFRAVMPLAFQALGTSGIMSNNDNIYVWGVYASSSFRTDTDSVRIITSAYYNPKVSKNTYYTNTELSYANNDVQIIWTLPNNFSIVKESFIKNAYLASSKEYTFNITTQDTSLLIPKQYALGEGESVYYNNQILTYKVPGHLNSIYVSDPDSFIFPMFNTIDLTYGYNVTKIIPWRNYLVICTTNNIYLAEYGVSSGTYTSKLINTNVGVPNKDANTTANVLNSIIFKAHDKIYKIVPSIYAATDSVMNTVCISGAIEDYLNDTQYDNFAFSTDEHYYLFIPNDDYTMCYAYNHVKGTWTISKYPVRLTRYDYINTSDVRVYSSDKQFHFNKMLEDVFEEIPPNLEYGDYMSITYNPVTDSKAIDSTVEIPFYIDFGQKSSKYTENKQFLETRLILETMSEKDMFPFEVSISTDGMPRDIHIDATTDSAIWKNSLVHTGTLSTHFVNNDSYTTGILRQMMLKYSGRGKTIRHVLSGNSKFRFKFYSLDYKYRTLPNK